MSKKKKTRTVTVDVPLPKPVFLGGVVAAFFEETQSMLQELKARREFDAHMVQFLKSKGLLEEFEEYRKTTPINKP